ncbi:MAG: PP2C family serine/threonine-protein phosphatase [Gammaproteobacteria bacterium]
MTTTSLGWHSATVTHVGNVRKLNEDSCLDRNDIGLWVVADGMGGHAAGDLASQLVVSTLAKVPEGNSLSEFVDAVEDAILYANSRLVNLSAETQQTSGSTVVAFLAREQHGIMLWAGDSRLYRLRAGRLKQLTTDHSQVEYYVQKGMLTREQALNHPAANMVTRAVGAGPDLYLDVDVTDLMAGDRYLLCSDGLDKHVPDPDIAALLGMGDPQSAAQNLIDATLARGATDNVTVSVIEIRPVANGGKAPARGADSATGGG